MYSSAGLTITEFASTTLGGKAKTWYLVLSTKAVAKVVLSVVIGTGIFNPPLSVGRAREKSIPLFLPAIALITYKGTAGNR